MIDLTAYIIIFKTTPLRVILKKSLLTHFLESKERTAADTP
jgi:hypothetical protein